MIYPTKRLVFLFLIPILVCFIVLLFASYADYIEGSADKLYVYLVIFNLALVGLLILDGWTIPFQKLIRAKRKMEAVFSIAYAHKIQLQIEYRPILRRKLRMEIREDIDERMSLHGFPKKGTLKKGLNLIAYRLSVHERGLYELKFIYLTCYSLFGLAKKVHKIDCQNTIRVYPDLKSISKYALLARRSHLGLMGVRKMRRSGGDNDFEMLKEYSRDDEFRHIDWKATARSGTLMVRSFQKTQNQNVIFLLDCGRMMTSEFQGKSLLDYTLSSMLLLAWVALQEGDRVGLLAFNDKILRYVRPQSGQRHHRKLIQASYDLKAQHIETNFDLAFSYLGTVCRQRSLLCLQTHIIDEMNAGQLESYLGTLAGRHLPFAVLLKIPELETWIDQTPRTNEEMFIQAGIADFLIWKEEVVQKLKNRNVLVMDALPEELNANLINEYLRIKARNLL